MLWYQVWTVCLAGGNQTWEHLELPGLCNSDTLDKFYSWKYIFHSSGSFYKSLLMCDKYVTLIWSGFLVFMNADYSV